MFLVALAIAAGDLLRDDPKYESTSKVSSSRSTRAPTRRHTQPSFFLNTRAQSYADLAHSSELAERVIEVLDLDMTPAELSEEISTEVVAGDVPDHDHGLGRGSA